jgi:hypothetical protein
VEHELVQLAGPVDAQRRAVVPARETREGDLHVLTREIDQRFRQGHHDFEDVGRDLIDGRNGARAFHAERHLLEFDDRIAPDRRLAGEDRVPLPRALIVDVAVIDAHAARAALPGAAIMRDDDPLPQSGVKQRIARARLDPAAVDEEGGLGAHEGSP